MSTGNKSAYKGVLKWVDMLPLRGEGDLHNGGGDEAILEERWWARKSEANPTGADTQYIKHPPS